MTGEEKRRILKEQYKRDLKLRKEFLDKAKGLRQQSNVNRAISGMLEGLNDDSDEWINKLNEGTAMSEARFEMALDEAEVAEDKLKKMASEAETEKMNARSLVEQMKREMGLLEDEPVVELDVEELSVEEETNSEEKTDSTDDASGGKSMGDF